MQPVLYTTIQIGSHLDSRPRTWNSRYQYLCGTKYVNSFATYHCLCM